ncbi:Hypothetical protein ERS075629_00786 [Mycobacteroides abscessus]|nr:Hypothetical protein ERS075501_01736 [Mycobacteroides abscessus]SHY02171.1 Uncharacterised protein [Mycobacteroides abscessus subsp. abscessus]CPS33643.1 Hypothetical protein ERS075513_00786 [Mycobacteroides abscessus]CPY28998.1 Hypothetical protein ERS075629_00786 [Mycobacteroides abscessus]CPY30346.1 Hypothetical protein ERS075631_00905 [Mycobacteroides abscessus]
MIDVGTTADALRTGANLALRYRSAMAPLLTLGMFLFFGLMMYIAYRQRKQPRRPLWRNPYMPSPYLWRGAPDWPDTPRPPWPVDDDGNPIDVDEADER